MRCFCIDADRRMGCKYGYACSWRQSIWHTILCEQVVGRALRRQSYELNEDGLFDVEYADVLGIPFDFAAEPVVIKPRPPRETIRVRAMRERDQLEIRFPKVEGYRTELPNSKLTANFTQDHSSSDTRTGWSIHGRFARYHRKR